MSNQFFRTESLLGEVAMEKIKKAHVAVFGIGGVGSFAAEALARSGIGEMTLVDNDRVEVTNLNRQLIALHSTLGKPKVDVMRDRILDIHPHAVIHTFPVFFGPDTSGEFDFTSYSYVVDAVDTVTAKLELIRRAKDEGIPVISCMGAGNKLDPAAFEVEDIYKTSVCPLAKVMREELRRRGVQDLKVVYSREKPRLPFEPEEPGSEYIADAGDPGLFFDGSPAEIRRIPGSISVVPSVAGLILAGEVVRDLIKME